MSAIGWRPVGDYSSHLETKLKIGRRSDGDHFSHMETRLKIFRRLAGDQFLSSLRFPVFTNFTGGALRH